MEKIRIHTCESMKEHNRLLVEEGGCPYFIVLDINDQWRLHLGLQDYAILIDYCPFCGRNLQ